MAWSREGKKLPDNMATIDHLYSRMDPRRYVQNGNETSHVLACRKCNLERSKEDLLKCAELHKIKSSLRTPLRGVKQRKKLLRMIQ